MDPVDLLCDFICSHVHLQNACKEECPTAVRNDYETIRREKMSSNATTLYNETARSEACTNAGKRKGFEHVLDVALNAALKWKPTSMVGSTV